MYGPDAPRSLINYRDLRANGIHISTMENDEKALMLRKGQSTLATAKAGADGLYEIVIKTISPGPRPEEEVGFTVRERSPSMRAPNLAPELNLYLTAATLSDIWHIGLGHPGTNIYRRMLSLLPGHTLTATDANKVTTCEACIQGKMIKRPSQWQLPTELPPLLHRLQGDICGPINPPSGPFWYFLVLIDASGNHLEGALLSTRNLVFLRILAILLRYTNHFPDYPVIFFAHG